MHSKIASARPYFHPYNWGVRHRLSGRAGNRVQVRGTEVDLTDGRRGPTRSSKAPPRSSDWSSPAPSPACTFRDFGLGPGEPLKAASRVLRAAATARTPGVCIALVDSRRRAGGHRPVRGLRGRSVRAAVVGARGTPKPDRQLAYRGGWWCTRLPADPSACPELRRPRRHRHSTPRDRAGRIV